MLRSRRRLAGSAGSIPMFKDTLIRARWPHDTAPPSVAPSLCTRNFRPRTGGTKRPCDQIREVSTQDKRDSQQGVERGISQVSFDKADHGVRQAGLGSKLGHGEPLGLPRLPQKASDLACNCFTEIALRHNEGIPQIGLD